MNTQRERLTYSINGAAFAVAKGCTLLRTFREPGSRKVTLVLDDSYGQASEALYDYWNSDALISARTLFDARRIVFDTLNNPTESTKETTENGSSTTSPAD